MSRQVDGVHYSMPISPVEYIEKNKLGFTRGNIVKYVSRDKAKNKDKDIQKAIHYCLMVLEYDYNYTEQQIAEVLDRFRPKTMSFTDVYANIPKIKFKDLNNR